MITHFLWVWCAVRLKQKLFDNRTHVFTFSIEGGQLGTTSNNLVRQQYVRDFMLELLPTSFGLSKRKVRLTER